MCGNLRIDYIDEYYFVRGKSNHDLCTDSAQYILDPLFSTGYDYKVSKIICNNERLRIYLNKKKYSLEKQVIIKKNRDLLPHTNLKWTGSKANATELGYSRLEKTVKTTP
jgi:hypothetical protein